MTKNKRYEVAIYDDKAISGYCVLDKDQPCPTCRLKYHNVFISTKAGCEIVTDLLNKLDSENKELKKVLQYETQMHNKWKTECTNEIKENNKIKNTIKEMYETERTQLGQSVLKQLLEQIQ